jgi:hypothetical protein
MTDNPLRINLTHPEWYIKETMVYPPFKEGLYLEEYFFNKMMVTKNDPPPFELCSSDKNTPVVDGQGRTYLPLFWTNYQLSKKSNYDDLSAAIEEYMQTYPPVHPDKGYFTLVQYDDGPLVQHPNIYVYGSGKGHPPLPLIYEDRNQTLIRQPRPPFYEKPLLCSFVGSNTHLVRIIMLDILTRESKPDVYVHTQTWTPEVSPPATNHFIEVTRHSKFTLAPRGYGVQSFRFYEAFELGSIPVYIHNTQIQPFESKTVSNLWLPYQDRIDYHKICIIWHVDDIDTLIPYLRSITSSQYHQMQANYHDIKHLFTLDYMCESILHDHHRTDSSTN